ncbi:TPA: hypothetical protein DIC38_01310 [Candidatus Nomurabacteria bacterium]|nr:MAG: hypothetical protein O210_OD1C00001G0470 [Parcubacteria bacterium RAAC4_OD1_1]HCY26304.1 hypothetical protein [Candidatus Nomurabacteria bacterium]
MRFLFSLSFIVLSIILFVVFTNPTYKEVGTLKMEVLQYKDAINNLNNLETLRDELLLSYRDIKEEDKEKLKHLLPDAVSSIELVLEIEKIASENMVVIKDVDFGSDKEATLSNSGIIGDTNTLNNKYGEYTIGFKLEAEYESFNKFLSELEKNLRLVDVESIKFDTMLSTKEEGSILVYDLEIKTYWLK